MKQTHRVLHGRIPLHKLFILIFLRVFVYRYFQVICLHEGTWPFSKELGDISTQMLVPTVAKGNLQTSTLDPNVCHWIPNESTSSFLSKEFADLFKLNRNKNKQFRRFICSRIPAQKLCFSTTQKIWLTGPPSRAGEKYCPHPRICRVYINGTW